MRAKPLLPYLFKFVGNGLDHSVCNDTTGSERTRRNGQDRSLRSYYKITVYLVGNRPACSVCDDTAGSKLT